MEDFTSSQSKAVLEGLRHLAADSTEPMGYLGNSNCICLASDYDAVYDYTPYAEHINGIIRQLGANGYIIFCDSRHSTFCLTEKAIAKDQLLRHRVRLYLADKAIDIAALIIAIIALIVSCI